MEHQRSGLSSRQGLFIQLYTRERGRTPVSPLRVGHCLSSCTYFDSARLTKDKASFLLELPASRSKGAGVDARRDRAGVEEKGSHAARHTAPRGLLTVAPEVDGNCPKCDHCTGLPGGSSPTTGSDGYHGDQQRALPRTAGRTLLSAHLAPLVRLQTASL